ncbi:cullin-3-B-like [Drosophila nasuta]|uniref:cullin-3-B-like n=1 Tax=Drosophila nasuta TaxID=42062 RepID=UPI00295E7487|nr:cullin-3-B-like [Drosophila nasuta]XP_060662406.1 cullin-3-B-like [Drosophila nasuta]
MDEKYVKYVWIILKSAIQELQKDNPGLSHEELYHKAYEVVMNKHGFRMYNGLRELLTDHLKQNVREELISNLNRNFLSKLNEVWIEHQTSMRMLSDMLGYMDRSYAEPRGLESVYILGLQLFRYEIIEFEDIKLALRQNLLDLIEAERLGESINQLEIKNICTMLHTLGKNTRYVYEKIFEEPFLAQTEKFYELEAAKLLENKAVDFEQEMKLHIEKESARLSKYLDKVTEQKVVKLLEEIIKKYKT